MTILSKKRFGFNGGEDMKFETQGNSIIEDAPEWIAKTDLYKMAVEDGSIIEVVAKTEKPVKSKK